MPPVVIDLHSTEDPRDAVHRAVQALAEGGLVAFPTETVYVVAASALREDAMARLVDLAGRPSLAVKSVDEALDYAPRMSPLAIRIARRCWPGPVCLVLADDHPDSVLKQLPAAVQRLIADQGLIRLQSPGHPVLVAAQRLAAGPIALACAMRTSASAPEPAASPEKPTTKPHRGKSAGKESAAGKARDDSPAGRGEVDRPCQGPIPEAVTAQDVLSHFGKHVDLVLDDGRTKFAQPSSVVQIFDRRVEVLRSGVVSAATLNRLASLTVLFVCTGNTCRSPMAEALCKRRIAERLGCEIDALEERGVIVASAGLAANVGGAAAVEAVGAMRDRGLDLSRHESQPLSDRLLRFADYVFAMTRSHRAGVLSQWPEAAGRVFLLDRDHEDISDPIGGTAEEYRRCAEHIDRQITGWLDELDLERLPAF